VKTTYPRHAVSKRGAREVVGGILDAVEREGLLQVSIVT
jgi:hypothetical protein